MLEDIKLILCKSLHAGSKVRFTEKPKVSFMYLITLPKRICLMGPEEGDMVEVMVMDVDEGEAGVGGDNRK